LNILIISSFLLFKDTRFGGSKRLYYFVEELKQYGSVDLICIDGCKEIDSFKNECRKFNYFKIVQRNEKRDLISRVIFSDLDLRANRYDTIEEVSKYLKSRVYDAVLIAFPLALGFLKFIPKYNKNVAYIEDDLHFEKIRQVAKKAKYFSLTNAIKTFKYFQTLRFYKNHLKRVKKFICISDQEKQIVFKKFPSIECQILKYGINIKDFPPMKGPNNKSIGFIGNFKHQPNTDAVHYLFESIIEKNDCNYQVIIGGKNPPEDFFQNYGRFSNVKFLNNLEYLDDFYRNIDVFINPIVSGRGLRTKIIEAAAFGRPIVSTPLGGEGLEDLEILYFNNKAEFYNRLEFLCNNKEKYSDIVVKNMNVVCSNYEISKVVNQLASILKIV
jgi:glycosyltransferase involved in cell wall biosynthesis